MNYFRTQIQAFCAFGILVGTAKLTCNQTGSWVGENNMIEPSMPRCITNETDTGTLTIVVTPTNVASS